MKINRDPCGCSGGLITKKFLWYKYKVDCPRCGGIGLYLQCRASHFIINEKDCKNNSCGGMELCGKHLKMYFNCVGRQL